MATPFTLGKIAFGNRDTNFPHRKARNEALSALDSWLDQSFNEAFGSDLFGDSFFKKNSYPKCNVINFPSSLEIEASVPGMQKADISIEVSGDFLTIKGDRISENRGFPEDLYLMREVKRSAFSRTFQLNSDAYDMDKVEAKVRDGLLTITIPKKKPSEEIVDSVKKIEIKD